MTVTGPKIATAILPATGKELYFLVYKQPMKYTPFSYRRSAIEGFSNLFEKFSDNIIVLSYSSNGYPDLEILVDLLKKVKKNVDVKTRDHRYHFGTHKGVKRAVVQEYLIIGK